MNGVQCAFTGRIGNDPEPKYLPSGKSLLEFRVCVDQSYVADENRPAPESLWIKVTCWEPLANELADTLRKGSTVYVMGRLKLDRWTSKDGEARSGLSCSAWQVDLHGQIGKQAPPRQPVNAPKPQEPPDLWGGWPVAAR